MSAQQNSTPNPDEWRQGLNNKLDFIDRYCECVGREAIEDWLRTVCEIRATAAKLGLLDFELVEKTNDITFKLTGRIIDYVCCK